jgi:hypothetical protein
MRAQTDARTENMFGDILSDNGAGLMGAWAWRLGRHWRRMPCSALPWHRA